MKFTSYKANGILQFEANSILFRPLLPLLGTQGLSDLLDLVEVTAALLLALDRVSPLGRCGVYGTGKSNEIAYPQAIVDTAENRRWKCTR
jgi:hypothetical protein